MAIFLTLKGTVVFCGGGGGAPVVEAASGYMHGVDAVIDKDLTATLLALDSDADALLILTDVGSVMQHFGTPQENPISSVYVDELASTDFALGSMAPKIEACSNFVSATGRSAYIGALDDAQDILAGLAGTTILDRRSEDIIAGRRAL